VDVEPTKSKIEPHPNILFEIRCQQRDYYQTGSLPKRSFIVPARVPESNASVISSHSCLIRALLLVNSYALRSPCCRVASHATRCHSAPERQLTRSDRLPGTLCLLLIRFVCPPRPGHFAVVAANHHHVSAVTGATRCCGPPSITSSHTSKQALYRMVST
jgi:hypothetical protein